MKYIAELKDSIGKILNQTSEGSIVWGRINPTTFTWTKREPGAGQTFLDKLKGTRVDLQGVEISPTENKFIFTIKIMETGNIIVSIDTSLNEYEELNDILEELYFTIQDYFDKQIVNHVEDLLK